MNSRGLLPALFVVNALFVPHAAIERKPPFSPVIVQVFNERTAALAMGALTPVNSVNANE